MTDHASTPTGLDAELITALQRFVALTGATNREHVTGVGSENSSRPVLLALDFDGTLAPLVPNPADSRCTPDAAEALRNLAPLVGVEVALVSGRPVRTLEELAQPPSGVHLIGSHGAEIGIITADGYETEIEQLTPEQDVLLTQTRHDLEAIAVNHAGVWVEHKPTSTVLHTRPATPEVATIAVESAFAGPAAREGITVLHGKEVVELGVLTATKGDAITQLRDQLNAQATLFIGDDVTDEHAFAVLNDGRAGRKRGEDVGIKVGAGDSAAQYRVADPESVGSTLTYLVQLFDAV